MDLNNLDALQEEMMRQTFTFPEEMEALIKDTSEKVAREVLFTSERKSTVEFMGEVYIFTAIIKVFGFKKYILMYVANVEHMKLGGSKYRPFTATAEVDNSFSDQENLQTAVEGFLRHITGTERPEILEDDEEG